MKPKYLLIFNLLISLVATSQQIALPGVVSIQNSEYNTGTREYVFEASITADFATDKLTDSQGVFLLEFVSEKNGSATKIKVFKAGLEIVNAKALEDAIIGRTPALNIYMCKEGELAENQVKYHYISLKNLYAERDRRIALLEKGRTTMKAEIERLEEELNTEIYTKKDAILQLHQQIEDLENKLPEFAKKLAIVNLDDASKLYKKAFELYINGNVKEAISLLDIDKLLAKGQETTNSLKSLRKQSQIIIETIALLEKQIEQTVKSLELGAELQKQQFKHKKASEYYKAIITVLESDPEGREKDIAKFNNNIGVELKEAGNYSEALKYCQKSLAINKQIYGQFHTALAKNYNNISVIYLILLKPKEALDSQKKALEIDEQLYDEYHPDIAMDHNNLAMIYQAMGKYKDALAVQEKSLAINERLYDNIHPSISLDYNNLATIYKSLGKLNKALKAQKQSHFINNQLYKDIHPMLSRDYNNFAIIYKELGNFEEALQNQRKSLNINKQIYKSIHPTILRDYINLAQIYYDFGKYKEAILVQEKMLEYIEKSNQETNISIAKLYNKLALTYQNLDRYDEALVFQQRSIIIFGKIYSKNNSGFQIVLRNLSNIYFDIGLRDLRLKKYENALVFFKKALENLKNEAIIYDYIATCYHHLKEYEKSIESHKRTAQLYPDIKKIYYYHNIGTAYVKNKQFPEALNAFQEFEKLGVDNGRAYRNYAMYYALQNQPKKAIEMLQKAIELGYKDIEWLRTDDSMDSLRSLPEFQEILKKIE